MWGGTFDKYLNLLRTTINSLLRIAFKKPFRSNTDILFNTHGILNLKKSHAKELLTNLYSYILDSVSFNHNYSTRNTINNNFKINKYNTEFGKRDPFNIGMPLCMQYDIPIKLFNNYDQYKKYIKYKITICL